MSRPRGRGASRRSIAASRRWMRTAKRRPDGTVIGFDRPTLYEIVKDGTELAAKLWPSKYPCPERVSVRAFNGARFHLESKYGRLPPQAHAICKGLSDYNGGLWEWPELVATVHDPSKDIDRVDHARLARPNSPMNDRRLEYAVLRIAYLHKQQTLRPHEYRAGFEQLTQHGATKNAAIERSWFSLLLPSEGQLQGYVDNDWPRAVTQASLLAPPVLAPPEIPRGLDRDWGITLFYAERGWLPLRCELEGFARKAFALAPDDDLPWPEWIARGTRRIAELGLPPPPSFEIRSAPNWTPIHVDIGPLSPSLRSPYTMREVFEWLRLFHPEPPLQQLSRQRRWQAFARAKGAPSWNVLARRGGIDKLLRLAARDDWEEQAARLDAESAKPRQKKSAPRRETRPALTLELARIATHEKADAIVEQLEEHGVMTAQELAAKLKFRGRTVRYYLHALLAAKRIDLARRIHRGRAMAAYTLTQPPT